MQNELTSMRKLGVLLFLGGGALAGMGAAQSAAKDPAKPAQTGAPSAKASSAKATAPATSPAATLAAWRTFQAPYYRRKWGVDIVGVRVVASGSMIEFRYRVIDAKKAAILNDKRWNPYLEDLASGVKLAVPTMEKVGQLRQAVPVEEDRVYWMMFANPAKMIKPGNRVNIVIGDFQAKGMVVE